MARLIIPERCAVCKGIFHADDRILMERQALLQERTRYAMVVTDGKRKWAPVSVLEPRIASKSPTNVRHKECA